MAKSLPTYFKAAARGATIGVNFFAVKLILIWLCTMALKIMMENNCSENQKINLPPTAIYDRYEADLPLYVFVGSAVSLFLHHFEDVHENNGSYHQTRPMN